MSQTREFGIHRFPAETMVAGSTRMLAGLALTPGAFGRVGQFEDWGTSTTWTKPTVRFPQRHSDYEESPNYAYHGPDDRAPGCRGIHPAGKTSSGPPNTSSQTP